MHRDAGLSGFIGFSFGVCNLAWIVTSKTGLLKGVLRGEACINPRLKRLGIASKSDALLNKLT